MAEQQPSDEEGPGKGDRVAIVEGRKGRGVHGEIFWVGDNRYGPGLRVGVRGDDGETYWVDQDKVRPEAEVGPPPAVEPPAAGPELAKGARVRLTGGPDAGAEGEVFWVGESRFGPGLRYGVRDGEETYWVDDIHVEALDEAPAAPPGDPGPGDDPPEALAETAFDEPPPGYGGDAPAEPPPFDEPPPDDEDLPF